MLGILGAYKLDIWILFISYAGQFFLLLCIWALLFEMAFRQFVQALVLELQKLYRRLVVLKSINVISKVFPILKSCDPQR